MDANDLSGKGLYDNRTMIGCAYAEQTYWQRRMHQGYEALFVWAGERTHDPKDRYSSLTDMRAKWIDFVDAKCLSLGSVNYGGRESSIHHAGCKLTEVARHALELESRINSYCEIQSTAAFEEACKQRNLARP